MEGNPAKVAEHIPLTIVGGIYRLIDMGITTTNCMGDLVGTVIIARSEERARSETGNSS